MTATHRQNVISNNLANENTVGFKRDLALLQQRRLGAQELPNLASYSDRFFDNMGGGTLLSPTETDYTQGINEPTASPLDVALVGDGFFAVEKDGQKYLTRNGNFTLNKNGELMLADGSNARVLDDRLTPIRLNPLALQATNIGQEGQIRQTIQGVSIPIATLAMKKADPSQLTKKSQQLLEVRGGVEALGNTTSVVQQHALERSNVDPATTLVDLIEAQRLLEANANMIRYQDQTLGRLVNDVAKIS